MKVEMGSVQTILEKTIDYWKRYHACVDIFTVWLTDAERVLEKPPEQRGVSDNKMLSLLFFHVVLTCEWLIRICSLAQICKLGLSVLFVKL